MGKIGNKSAAFINHKHFHPANRENLEKVWLAEQKHKEALKRQKEMKEKLAEEIRITELKRRLREQEIQNNLEYLRDEKPTSKYDVSDPSKLLRNGASGLILTKTHSEPVAKSKDNANHRVVIRSRYREDVFEHGHTAVFGSYYDRETGSWGYRCCKVLRKCSRCTVGAKKTASRDIDRNVRKRELEEGAENVQTKVHKAKTKGELSMAETLDKLKKMEALD